MGIIGDQAHSAEDLLKKNQLISISTNIKPTLHDHACPHDGNDHYDDNKDYNDHD